MKHTTGCRWILTTNVECEYRSTHHYCPHPEHACDCTESRTFDCNSSGVQREHLLKVHPARFVDLLVGRRTVEIRPNDRGYREGDLLVLCEYDPIEDCYTKRALRRTVTHILDGPQFGLKSGYVAMSLAAI